MNKIKFFLIIFSFFTFILKENTCQKKWQDYLPNKKQALLGLGGVTLSVAALYKVIQSLYQKSNLLYDIFNIIDKNKIKLNFIYTRLIGTNTTIIYLNNNDFQQELNLNSPDEVFDSKTGNFSKSNFFKNLDVHLKNAQFVILFDQKELQKNEFSIFIRKSIINLKKLGNLIRVFKNNDKKNNEYQFDYQNAFSFKSEGEKENYLIISTKNSQEKKTNERSLINNSNHNNIKDNNYIKINLKFKSKLPESEYFNKKKFLIKSIESVLKEVFKLPTENIFSDQKVEDLNNGTKEKEKEIKEIFAKEIKKYASKMSNRILLIKQQEQSFFNFFFNKYQLGDILKKEIILLKQKVNVNSSEFFKMESTLNTFETIIDSISSQGINYDELQENFLNNKKSYFKNMNNKQELKEFKKLITEEEQSKKSPLLFGIILNYCAKDYLSKTKLNNLTESYLKDKTELYLENKKKAETDKEAKAEEVKFQNMIKGAEEDKVKFQNMIKEAERNNEFDTNKDGSDTIVNKKIEEFNKTYNKSINEIN